jgi:hypothetical protein
MRLALAAVILTAALVAAGCGGSSQSSADKAKSTACGASADIKTQVAKLKGMTVGTASVDEAKKALQAISADLKTIGTQAPQIKGGLKGQLETANAAFSTALQQVKASITSAGSLTGAATAIATAGSALSASYEQAFAGLSC